MKKKETEQDFHDIFVKKLSEIFQLNFTYNYDYRGRLLIVKVYDIFIFSYAVDLFKKYNDVDYVIKNDIGYIAKVLEERLPFEMFMLEFNKKIKKE